MVAHLRTGRPGRTLALRSDIDALPIHERDRDRVSRYIAERQRELLRMRRAA